METLESNKQKLKYALFVGEENVYETDDDGNVIYVEVDGENIPVETGNKELRYSQPVTFKGNISMGGGEAEAKEFGIDASAYDAILLCKKDEFPIAETSLIWHKSEVGYKDTGKTIVDPKTADYSVAKISESLNYVRFFLKRRM